MPGGRRSTTAHSIIAIKGKALAAKGFNQGPPLNNRELFRRDRHMCAYCGGEFSYFRLTRDHITPLSRGGRDTWMNVVTTCRHCNGHKRNRLPQECGRELLYAPYVPNQAQYLILTNRRILLGCRQKVLDAQTVEGAHMTLVKGGVGVPPMFIDQLVHVILRNGLDGTADPLPLRAAEVFFREQKAPLKEGHVLLADLE